MDLKFEESIPSISQTLRQEETFNILQHKLTPSKLNLLAFLQQNASLIQDPITNDIASYLQTIGLHHLITREVSFEALVDYAETRVNKMMKNKRIKKNWNHEDLKILILLVSLHGKLQSKTHHHFLKQDWEQISQLIPGTDSETVMFKWLSLSKNKSPEKFWSESEKLLLQSIIKEEGSQNWSKISKSLYKRNRNPNKFFRTPKKCRQFWNCYLNPKLKKGPWKNQEDQLLMSLVIENQGRKRWSQFVKQFEGRTENALKNRFNLLMGKFQKQWRVGKIEELQLVQKIHYHYQEVIASELLLIDQQCLSEQQNKEKQNVSKKIKRQRIRVAEKEKKKDDGDWLEVICKNTNYIAYQKIREKINGSDSDNQRKTRKQVKKAVFKTYENQIQYDRIKKEEDVQMEENLQPFQVEEEQHTEKRQSVGIEGRVECKKQVQQQFYERGHADLSESALYLMDWSQENENLKEGKAIEMTNSLLDPEKTRKKIDEEQVSAHLQLLNEQSRFSFGFD